MIKFEHRKEDIIKAAIGIRDMAILGEKLSTQPHPNYQYFTRKNPSSSKIAPMKGTYSKLSRRGMRDPLKK